MTWLRSLRALRRCHSCRRLHRPTRTPLLCRECADWLADYLDATGATITRPR